MKYKLKDVCNFYSGTGFPTKYQGEIEGDYPFYKVGDIANNVIAGNIYLAMCNNYVSIDTVKKIKGCVLPPNTVVFAKIGEALKLNRRAITSCACLIDNNAMGIAPKEDTLRIQYFYFFMKNLKMQVLAESTTVPSVRKTILEDYKVEIPSLNIQEEIESRLTIIQDIIEKRKKELSLLDNLIKARFVEMFGDVRENPNGYAVVPFIDIVEYMGDIGSNGANKVVVEHLDMKDEEDYAMMVRFTNFTKNDFADDVKYISKDAYDFLKKSQIFGGELIICKIGSAGQNYVMPFLDRPVSLGLNQIMVKIKENILMPYLYQYLHTDYGELLISGCINGAVTKTITKTELKKIPVMLPQMELQKEFVLFVHQVDKSKVVVQKALDETKLLFDLLMQKYFG